MNKLRINPDRLMHRLQALGGIGALSGGGVCRLALSDADKDGRDLVCSWMRELGLDISIDVIGNVIATRPGKENRLPVLMGSHIDTVATGGLYDGNLGVLAGLEVIETLNEANLETLRPIAVGFFTNEEGSRFAPDMMGSGVHQGALHLDTCLATKGIDGTTVGEDLHRIGYAGNVSAGSYKAHAFLELHIEQGPVLEEAGVDIGAVTGVQGISWTEYLVRGTSNHAGTTPMRLRHDAGYAAASICTEARKIARDMGGDQVATCGVIELNPNLVNVIARQAKVTVDLRNTNEELLCEAEQRMSRHIEWLGNHEGVDIESNSLARFAPVDFDSVMVERVAKTARELGYSVKHMPSGAGHDAQMFAPNCPTGMIFVPSRGGISHNIKEYTAPEQIQAGADILLQIIMDIAGRS